MLKWRELSTAHKIQGAFISLLFVMGGAIALIASGFTLGTLTVAGSLLCGFSFILNPKAFSSPVTAGVPRQGMPLLCRLFLTIGIPLFFVGAALGHL